MPTPGRGRGRAGKSPGGRSSDQRGGGSVRGRNSGGGSVRGGGSGTGSSSGYSGSSAQVFHDPKAGPVEQDVKKFEDRAVSGSKSTSSIRGYPTKQLKDISLNAKPPTRPDYGTSGKEVTLSCNHFKIDIDPKVTLFSYNIKIEPEAKGKQTRRLVETCFEKNLANLKGNFATDYKKILVANHEVITGKDSWKVHSLVENEDIPASDEGSQHTVTLEQSDHFSVGELLSFLSSPDLNINFPRKLDMLRLLNTIIGHVPKTASLQYPASMMSIANNHYPLGPPKNKSSLHDGLEAFRGYFLSVRPAAQRLLLNVQVKHAATYKVGPLVEVMKKVGGEGGLKDRLSELQHFFRNVRVRTSHAEKRNRSGDIIPDIRKICGFAQPGDYPVKGPPKAAADPKHPLRVTKFGTGPDNVSVYYFDEFRETEVQDENKKGLKKDQSRYYTVKEFFKEMYNTECDASLPVVNLGTQSHPIYLPMEVCEVLPGQPVKSELKGEQTEEMIKVAVRKPHENFEWIACESLEDVLITGNNVLKNFNMSVLPGLIKVPGRTLQGISVQYKNESIPTKDGSWNMQKRKFMRGAFVEHWSVILLKSGNGTDDAFVGSAKAAVEQFCEVMRGEGMIVGNPCRDRQGNFLEERLQGGRNQWKTQIDLIFKNLEQALGAMPSILLILLPKYDGPIYNIIKCLGDIKYGVHTVCAVGNKFTSRKGKDGGFDPGFLANISLKFNLKLGGSNHQLPPDQLGIVGKGNTMLVGYDVTHPSPGSREEAPSILGIVASTGWECDRFPGELRVQQPRQEKADALAELLANRLQLWKKKSIKGDLPENIIFYRDGVSEGQYQIVLDEELPQIRNGCKKTYTDLKYKNKRFPRITIIIVGKRHHTRFYPNSPDDADRSGNPKSGTVVDRIVTEHRNWDFFLQAHAAIQGTAKPTHYFVVHDEIFAKDKLPKLYQVTNTADVLQTLTHNLCYLHGRATKAVSVAPPAYLADLLCDRGRRYLSGIFSPPADESDSNPNEASNSQQLQDQVKVHGNLTNTMFYI